MESMWRMVSTAPSCCRKSENFPAQILLHSVHYLLATCSIFPLICYMLMLVLLESTTRFWQDVAEASLLTGCRPDFPGTRRTAVSLLRSTSAPPLAKSSRMELVTSLELQSLKSCSFFHDEFEMKSCCYCLKFTWNCLTNCFVSGEIRTVLFDKCETSSFWDNLCLSTIYHVLFWDTACLTTIYQALQILQEKRQRIRTRAKTNPRLAAGMTNNAD